LLIFLKKSDAAAAAAAAAECRALLNAGRCMLHGATFFF
jgi:hypothetical protein